MTRRAPSPFDGFRLLGRRAGGASLSAQVEAILAGTTGFALDPSDVTTMHQDTARTVPVASASDPVGNIRSKWGTTVYDWQQATASFRPAWNGVAGLAFDGADDRLDAFSDLSVFAGISDLLACGKYKPTNFAAQRFPFELGSTTLAAGRVTLIFPTSAGVSLFARRNTEVGTTAASAGGVLSAGVSSVLTQRIAFTGTTNINSREDGAQIADVAFGAAAVTGGNAGRNTLGCGVAFGGFFLGSMGRMVFAPTAISDANRLIIEAWVGETAL